MIERLTIQGFGPAPKLDFEFGERLNLITGDNGVGKTFLIDLAWYALTRTWAGDKEMKPLNDYEAQPALRYHVFGKSGPNQEVQVLFNRQEQRWILPQRRPPMPGLVIYARLDGGFSVWDPARNYWRQGANAPDRDPERPSKFDLTPQQVWHGVPLPEAADASAKGMDKRVLCRGLIEDWNTWQIRNPVCFEQLTAALAELSPPHRHERLRPGQPRRVDLFDARDFPTLDLGYGEVPITQISAGMQRVLSLAYMLIWTWEEHMRVCRQSNQERASRVILLIDEVEAHLHPNWQRSLLPSVLKVMKGQWLFGGMELQMIVTTHSPMVCASVETAFRPEIDRLFNLKIEEPAAGGGGRPEVAVEQIRWTKRGDLAGWLTSPAFNMKSTYNREAEEAIREADLFMLGRFGELPQNMRTATAIDSKLRAVLVETDPYWAYWIGIGSNPAARGA